jgi:hypothetical protein
MQNRYFSPPDDHLGPRSRNFAGNGQHLGQAGAEGLQRIAAVPLLPEYPLQEIWLKALVSTRRAGTQRIDALLTWLKEHLSRRPWDRA